MNGTQKALLSFLFLLAFPSISSAETRTVTIGLTMPDTSNIQGYKVYYAYNEAMTDKKWHENCATALETTPGNLSITCQDVSIERYPVYFSVAAITADGDELASPPEAVGMKIIK